MIRRVSVSMSSLAAGATPSVPVDDSWPHEGSTETGPMAGDMPHRPTIWRAIALACSISFSAPVALIAFGLAAWQFPAVNPYQATLTYALAAVVTTVGFFASLLAHELAHSLVARHYGLTVNSLPLPAR